MWTVLSVTVMEPMLRASGPRCFSKTDLVGGSRAPALPRPRHDHHLAGGDDLEPVVVAGPVGGRRLADELREPGRERPETRAADREADLGDALIAPAQERLCPLDAAGHEVGV